MPSARPAVAMRAGGRDGPAGSLLDVEDEPRRPERDLVAGREPRAPYPAPVDLHAVRRLEIDYLPVPCRPAPQLGVHPRDVGIAKDAVALPGSSQGRDRPLEHVATVVERHDRARLDEACARLAALLRAALLLGRRVHHRLALLARHGLLALARGWLDEPSLDAELSQPQPLVRLQRDLGARQQCVIAPPRVLQEIPGELLLQRSLVALEALVVLGREKDRVLVGHVDLRHRGGPVRVHLLGQLPDDLDRLDLGAERTAEHALDEALDPGFEIAQNADRCSHSWRRDTDAARPRCGRARYSPHNASRRGHYGRRGERPTPGAGLAKRVVRTHSAPRTIATSAAASGPAAGSGASPASAPCRATSPAAHTRTASSSTATIRPRRTAPRMTALPDHTSAISSDSGASTGNRTAEAASASDPLQPSGAASPVPNRSRESRIASAATSHAQPSTARVARRAAVPANAASAG